MLHGVVPAGVPVAPGRCGGSGCSVRTTLDAVPGLVGKVLLYVVLALAVLIGGPFALGFWLGGVRARAGAKRKE